MNHGVIGFPKSTDYIAGTLPYKVRVADGNWMPYLVRGENQKFNNVETMACVSFSANTLCEMQIKQQTGREVNFSDRFLAKMSGTTSQGNSLNNVGDTLRHIGTVVEEEWPTPPEPFEWNTYYSDIPQFIINRATPQFKDKYSVTYEQIPVLADDINYHLKHAPLWTVIPGHAVAGIVLKSDNNTLTYFDTYKGSNNYIKTTPLSNVQYIYKLVCDVKTMSNAIFIHKQGTNEYGYFLPATTPESLKDKALNLGLDILRPDGTVDYSKAKDVNGL